MPPNKKIHQKKKKKKLVITDNQTPISSEEIRNWAELPPDVLSLIFLKLGAIDILLRAQPVCSTWRKASKEPSLFRSIDTRNTWDSFKVSLYDTRIGWALFQNNMYDIETLVKKAVDRSCGQLVEFSLERFCSDELLAYIADQSGSLRCLRLVSCYQVGDDALINVAKKAVLLEELEICHCSFSGDVPDMLETIGKLCWQLKSFRLNCRGYRLPHRDCDDEALVIAANMPQLHHIHLFGNKLTNVGLGAIPNGCLHLESLDLRQCFNLNLEGVLLKSCKERLIKLRLPNDPTEDYEFNAVNVDGDDDYESFYRYRVVDLGDGNYCGFD
ncbi:hypothetical protein C5167_037237 [Papaver somniferum]|uniref:F-box domain-containing protein n=1 Tax=Papaver somniferum TaxID=3469 RepID=A0A4Y7I5V3_PAPSO|nr:putative F-box/LRR-repeat protein 23 [Papaver somniferum]RZC44297.1 hypothetical protein C5167_037237 [Papaver somniferum]